MNVDAAWELAAAHVTCKVREETQSNREEVKNAISVLQENEFFDFYEELVFENFREDLKTRIMPTFCTQVLSDGAHGLLNVVKELHTNVARYFSLFSVWPNANEFAIKMREIFVTCLLWDLDSKMKNVFAEFYAHSFQANTWMLAQEKSEETFMEDDDSVIHDADDYILLEWNGKSRKLEKENVDSFLRNQFELMASVYLFDLDLLFSLAEQPVSQVLEIEIKRYVEQMCKGEYEKHWIHSHLQKWIETEVMQWLEKLFGKKWDQERPDGDFGYGMQTKFIGHTREHWNQKLTFILYETYTEMRIGEMFGIITDFPESSPAIEDLKICLERTNQRPYLIKTLKTDLSNRVLHPGVCTEDIITMYINAVKALRLLDPSGVVMEIVLEGYTKYLIGRDDTVKKIMACLLDDDRENDLAVELARGASDSGTTAPVHSRDPNDSFFIEEVTKKHDDWVPDPREADPEKPDKSRRTSDIISLLVGMYGSTKCFIEEYQELLSRKLLSNWCSNTSEDAEIKNLELLKLRFGEDDMGKCAVMLKDVADSRRINTYVKDEYSKQNETMLTEIEVSTLIVSSEYWPGFQLHDLTLPTATQKALEDFNKGYQTHKASRSLQWIHSAGRVDIELELKEKTLQFQVTMLLASVISLFQDKETWTLEEISSEIKVPASTLRRKIVYWLQQGILRETSADTYTIIEEQPGGSTSPRGSSSTKNDLENLLEEEEAEENIDAENEKQKQQEQVLWNYIQGMLMNFETLPLDRIHKMLRMFAMQDTAMQMDQSKLRNFLNGRVQSGTLCIEGGKYKLNKDK